MDKDTRSLLQRATQAARRVLEDELRAQLEGVYDIRPDGTVAAEAGRHLNEDGVALRVRAKLVAAVEHPRAEVGHDAGRRVFEDDLLSPGLERLEEEARAGGDRAQVPAGGQRLGV